MSEWIHLNQPLFLIDSDKKKELLKLNGFNKSLSYPKIEKDLSKYLKQNNIYNEDIYNEDISTNPFWAMPNLKSINDIEDYIDKIKDFYQEFIKLSEEEFTKIILFKYNRYCPYDTFIILNNKKYGILFKKVEFNYYNKLIGYDKIVPGYHSLIKYLEYQLYYRNHPKILKHEEYLKEREKYISSIKSEISFLNSKYNSPGYLLDLYSKNNNKYYRYLIGSISGFKLKFQNDKSLIVLKAKKVVSDDDLQGNLIFE
jgi:hypothetical protein